MKCNRDEDFLRCENSYRAAKPSYTKNKWEKCRLSSELSKPSDSQYVVMTEHIHCT